MRLHDPGNYGFVPHTLSEDGDPLEVLICNTRQLIADNLQRIIALCRCQYHGRFSLPRRQALAVRD
ncbi:MAG TPA: inorganic diphosphatase [Woeseiaceae bacterium]|nr:inorganic diphosphatase [Woeseiaceae bacterium]